MLHQLLVVYFDPGTVISFYVGHHKKQHILQIRKFKYKQTIITFVIGNLIFLIGNKVYLKSFIQPAGNHATRLHVFRLIYFTKMKKIII